MKIVNKVKERVSRTRYGKKFLEHYGFKTLVLAVLSLILSVAFALYNGVIGITERSVWYGALAAYYVTLILFRCGVLIADRMSRKRAEGDPAELLKIQYRIRLSSGAFLVIIAIAMGAAVTQMAMFAPPQKSDEILAITNAAYAFFKITMAIINMVKAKRYADPVSQALRCLNLADAGMSVVSLTVVLLTTFGEDSEGKFLTTMKACVGFVACAFVLALATALIVLSAKKLRSNKDE